MPTSNVTLTANGQLNVFTLTYNTANTSNVSEMPDAVTDIIYGTNQTITSTVPRWFPKTFMGWSSSSNSSTVSKKAGETISITGHTNLWTVF
jgi:hypothetical protein